MAEEVFYSEGKLIARGASSGIPRTALAGGCTSISAVIDVSPYEY